MSYEEEKTMKKLRHTSVFMLLTSSRRGFSLVETLLYTAIFSIVFLVVAETLTAAVRHSGTFRAVARIEQSAAALLERMIREIRDAQSIDTTASVLGAHPGTLVLNTTNASGGARAVKFHLDNGVVYLTEDGAVVGPLSSAGVTVSNLIFRRAATPRSEGVKIELTLQSGAGLAARSENFYATVVLRDSY